MNQIDIEEKSAKVLDLLLQIDKLNNLIQAHQNAKSASFMIEQYQNLRMRFLSELSDTMRPFQIHIRLNT